MDKAEARNSVTTIARSYIGGLDYAYFREPSVAQGPIRHNCYGFLRRVYREAGLPFPEYWGYLEMSDNLPADFPKAGDAVFTKRGNRRHVGIFVPDTNTVIHLSKENKNVAEDLLHELGEIIKYGSIGHFIEAYFAKRDTYEQGLSGNAGLALQP